MNEFEKIITDVINEASQETPKPKEKAEPPKNEPPATEKELNEVFQNLKF